MAQLLATPDVYRRRSDTPDGVMLKEAMANPITWQTAEYAADFDANARAQMCVEMRPYLSREQPVDAICAFAASRPTATGGGRTTVACSITYSARACKHRARNRCIAPSNRVFPL